jgi:hypothetical protein
MFLAVAVELPPLDSAISEELEQELTRQADILMARLSEGRERLTALDDLSAALREQLEKDELMLRRLDGILGSSTEPPLDSLDARLRGAELRDVAVRILMQRCSDEPVHYREWFVWVREAGYQVSGKDPLASFLAQITRSPDVERVGGARSGRYCVRSTR